MAMATPPPNQANDAEYAELSKRKLFSILTILKRMPLKNFFATFFKGKIFLYGRFFSAILKVSHNTNHMVVLKKNILNMVSLMRENCFAHILSKTPGYLLGSPSIDGKIFQPGIFKLQDSNVINGRL